MSCPARVIRCFLAISVCCLFFTAIPGPAQTGDRSGDAQTTDVLAPNSGDRKGPPESVSKELQETIHLFMMFKLKEALSLSDEQTLKIIPLVRELETIRWDFFSHEKNSRQELRLLVEDDESGDEKIIKTLEDLHDARRSFFDQEEALKRGIAESLSPRQQAQFQLFHDRFRDEMRQKIRRLRGLERSGTNGLNRGR